jgi:REP element-mobilizing transposase RayT
MSHVFHQLFYHFTWGTHSREPLIDRAWRTELLQIINEEVKTEEDSRYAIMRCLTMLMFCVDYRQHS